MEYLAVSIYIESFVGTCLKKKFMCSVLVSEWKICYRFHAHQEDLHDG
jgi:ribonucleotide reductase beta subunit family protein with ferritin-like domain